jgi:hypothetical protein
VHFGLPACIEPLDVSAFVLPFSRRPATISCSNVLRFADGRVCCTSNYLPIVCMMREGEGDVRVHASRRCPCGGAMGGRRRGFAVKVPSTSYSVLCRYLWVGWGTGRRPVLEMGPNSTDPPGALLGQRDGCAVTKACSGTLAMQLLGRAATRYLAGNTASCLLGRLLRVARCKSLSAVRTNRQGPWQAPPGCEACPE